MEPDGDAVSGHREEADGEPDVEPTDAVAQGREPDSGDHREKRCDHEQVHQRMLPAGANVEFGRVGVRPPRPRAPTGGWLSIGAEGGGWDDRGCLGVTHRRSPRLVRSVTGDLSGTRVR